MNSEAKVEAGMPAQPISDCALDVELLTYIFERSNNIARYSDKLSKSVEAIHHKRDTLYREPHLLY